jgi:hypothetical protein
MKNFSVMSTYVEKKTTSTPVFENKSHHDLKLVLMNECLDFFPFTSPMF